MKAPLIRLALKANDLNTAVRLALLATEENGSVYLANAFALVADSMSRPQFDGYLSALKAEGFYRPLDGRDFGALA